jgi:hypothetical protein
MKNTVLLKIAGLANLLFLMFHLPFYWMFRWEQALSGLTPDNRYIMLTFNIIANFLLFYFTFVLLRYPRLLLQNAVGKAFLLMVAGFYSIRIFAEFYFWGFSGVQSSVIILLCAIPVFSCLIPLFKTKEASYA